MDVVVTDLTQRYSENPRKTSAVTANLDSVGVFVDNGLTPRVLMTLYQLSNFDRIFKHDKM